MSIEKEGAVCAIIVAAGKGLRAGLGFNKVFAHIRGKTVIERTIDAFFRCSLVDSIILVINPDDESACDGIKSAYGSRLSIVHGGEERQQSVLNGLLAAPDYCDTVLIHDGARPFADEALIVRSIEYARRYGAACAGMPVKETIKNLDREGFIESTPDRSLIWAAQTPQSFRREIILKAHLSAAAGGIRATDDAMLVEAMGVKVRMFEGSVRNIKITSKEDLLYAEALLAAE